MILTLLFSTFVQAASVDNVKTYCAQSQDLMPLKVRAVSQWKKANKGKPLSWLTKSKDDLCKIINK